MADYNTRQRKCNLVVGGFVIIAFCAFLFMIYLFGELPTAVSRIRSYSIVANFKSAPGVQQNTPVRYCGYQVGRVVRVHPPNRVRSEEGESYHQVKVELAIEREYVDIPSNVEVLIMKRGLGSSYIELQVDPEKNITDVLEDGDEMQGSTGVSSEFVPKEVQEKIEQLVNSIDILAANANDIIGDTDNKTNIKQTLSNVSDMTAQATKTLKSIKDFSDSGLTQMEEASEKLNSVLIDMKQVIAKMTEGEGSVSRMLNDGELYENLLDSSRELQMTLEQLKIFAMEANEKGIKIKL